MELSAAATQISNINFPCIPTTYISITNDYWSFSLHVIIISIMKCINNLATSERSKTKMVSHMLSQEYSSFYQICPGKFWNKKSANYE